MVPPIIKVQSFFIYIFSFFLWLFRVSRFSDFISSRCVRQRGKLFSASAPHPLVEIKWKENNIHTLINIPDVITHLETKNEKANVHKNSPSLIELKDV